MSTYIRRGSLLISFSFLFVALCHTSFAGSLDGDFHTHRASVRVSPADLGKMKKKSTTETDPTTGKKSGFEGVLLSDVVDHALAGASNDRKALIDLVVFRNSWRERADTKIIHRQISGTSRLEQGS